MFIVFPLMGQDICAFPQFSARRRRLLTGTRPAHEKKTATALQPASTGPHPDRIARQPAGKEAQPAGNGGVPLAHGLCGVQHGFSNHATVTTSVKHFATVP
ncbi:hypothetical protein ACFFTM_00275 [Pseudoduganella plicata]|uniref:Uncharacterized protein n=1 Tax=Pseudoduganella plicata TaxID=321984 RepID=A0ABX5S819_9BURK|nr:hypothetical protein E1742_10125 [Pseudoduganella plicata]